MSPTTPPTDPVRLLDALDADAIAARLQELDREARALRVLLRSARARQRRNRPQTGDQREVCHAR
jgi:hypothetical protein